MRRSLNSKTSLFEKENGRQPVGLNLGAKNGGQPLEKASAYLWLEVIVENDVLVRRTLKSKTGLFAERKRRKRSATEMDLGCENVWVESELR